MLKNYLKIAVRSLARHRLYSLINVAGLATGIASSILIALYVYDEFSFDRFHAHADRIFRVTLEHTAAGEQTHLPYVGPSLAPVLVSELPGVEQAVRLGITAPAVLGNDADYVVPGGTETYYATPNVFDVFTFPLVVGDPTVALSEPYSIVLTGSFAQRFFGEVNPLGQFLSFEVHGQERQPLKVTGVLEDVPANSHLQYECLVSYATLEDINRDNPARDAQFVVTYLVLKENAAATKIEQQLQGFGALSAGAAQLKSRRLHLQSLVDIHLHSTHLDSDRAKRGNAQLVGLLLAIAIGIVVVAAINFINLSTARAGDRAKEIGLRKSLGAKKTQLVTQFLGESVLMSVIALVIGLVLVELVLPAFSAFTGKALAISYGNAWFIILGSALALGLLSGVYPALTFSGCQPIGILKGEYGVGTRSWPLRRVLVTLQFSMAVLLVIATGVVYQQLRYIQGKDLGFRKEHVLYTVIPAGTQGANDLFKNELLRHPNILNVGRAVVRPLYDMKSDFPKTPTLAELDGEMVEPATTLRRMEVGYDFLEVFDMRLLGGRSFSKNIAADATEAFILNETAVRAIGWPSPDGALGKALYYDERKGTVIGVLEDFHFESLHSSIQPFVLVFNRYSPMIFIKIAPDQMATMIAYVQQTWEKYSTAKESFHYEFMDTFYDDYYAPEMKLRTILICFALLTIAITCLGVLGLTSFALEQRKKEISIRKVLGASVQGLVFFASREFLELLLLANLLAWPLAYYFMNHWLQNFAYRSKLDISSFIAGGLLVGILAFVTAGYRAYQAARSNPVDNLRYE